MSSVSRCPKCETVNVKQESEGLTEDLSRAIVGCTCRRDACGHYWREQVVPAAKPGVPIDG